MSPERALAVVGPQLPSEAGLSARLRFHQSWYRAFALKIPEFGTTTTRPSRQLGSVLPDTAAERNRNFCSSAAADLYATRRLQGWGVDPVRCTRYMTSSQALTLNIFGPLFDAPEWMLQTLSQVMDRSDFVAVSVAHIEYAPRRRSDYLGDMTRLDIYALIETAFGPEALVAEVKYSDRFNSRYVEVADSLPYRQLADRVGLWPEPEVVLREPAINQLVRCHALGAAILGTEHAAERAPSILVIHHNDDEPARRTVDSYRMCVAEPERVRAAGLADFVRAMESTALTQAQRRSCISLRHRYIDLDASEELWRVHRAAVGNDSRQETRGGVPPARQSCDDSPDQH